MDNNEEQIHVFDDERIVNGILKTRQSIENIDAFLNKRHCDSKFGSISMYPNAVKEVKSAPCFGVSLNDLYEFKDGKLTERKDNETFVAFKMSRAKCNWFSRYGTSRRTEQLKRYGAESHLSSNFQSYTKRGDEGKCFYNLMDMGYFRPTLFINGGYDFAFDGSEALSSAELVCDFFVDGLNYTFRNCPNLKEVMLDVLSAHHEYINENVSERVPGTNVTWDDVRAKFPNLIKTAGAFGVGTVNALIQWNKNAELRRGSFNTAKHLSASFNGMVENCPALETISFPNFYLSDMINSENHTSANFKYNSIFSKHIGLSADQNVDLVFKDTTIKAFQDLVTDTIVEYNNGQKDTEEFKIVGMFTKNSLPFSSNYYPTKIDFGNTVTEIDQEIFDNYYRVNEMIIPKTVESIYSFAFNHSAYALSATFEERTIAEVQSMSGYPWHINTSGAAKIICTDGVITAF